jgi:putative IMPACT (imprinted ancient) family translation regulator
MKIEYRLNVTVKIKPENEAKLLKLMETIKQDLLIVNSTFRTIESQIQAMYDMIKSSGYDYAYNLYGVSGKDVISSYKEVSDKETILLKMVEKARRIGVEKISYRANDDGEPSNSAGAPIYGQIQSQGLTNVLVVIVRFFGGIKLGVGGLIVAYKTAAQMSLDNAEIIQKTIDIHYLVSFDYKNMNKVMRIIKEKKLEIVSQKMEINCEIEVATRKKNAEIIFDIFSNLHEISIKKMTL